MDNKPEQKPKVGIRQITKRLLPGEDLRTEIEKLVKKKKITAGCLLSIVGGLTKVKLRMAGGKIIKSWEGPFEIVSGTGTLSSLADCHIHISVSDRNGKVVGGHLKEGSIVSNTAEVVLLKFEGVRYSRKFNKKTGYEELVVDSK